MPGNFGGSIILSPTKSLKFKDNL